jgi:hypothetical protein
LTNQQRQQVNARQVDECRQGIMSDWHCGQRMSVMRHQNKTGT